MSSRVVTPSVYALNAMIAIARQGEVQRVEARSSDAGLALAGRPRAAPPPAASERGPAACGARAGGGRSFVDLAVGAGDRSTSPGLDVEVGGRGSARRPGPRRRRRSRRARSSARRRPRGSGRAPARRTRTGPRSSRRARPFPSCRRCRPGSRRRPDRRCRPAPSRRRGARRGSPARSPARCRPAPRGAGSTSWITRPAGVLDRCRPTCGRTMLPPLATVGVGDRQLQRAGLQVALADREVDVVADRPGAVGVAVPVELVAPLRGRHQARRPRPAGRCRSARRGRASSAQVWIASPSRRPSSRPSM